MGGWMNRCMDRWIDGWMDGWRNRWIVEGMEENINWWICERILGLYSGASIPPKSSGANSPPHLIGHPSFMKLYFSPGGKYKARRREAAIAEGKKPLATRGSG